MLRFLFETEGLMVPIEKVHQHPENDNNGDVDEIVASMRTIGVYRPVYASSETGYIVAGNHTYVGMLELGARFVPVVWLDGLTPAVERRILRADNKIARNARPDPGDTKRLLQQIVADAGGDVEAALVGLGTTEQEYLRIIKDPTPLDLSRVAGQETLEHRITCPACGHNWVRSGPKEADDGVRGA